jgi:CRP/FNR family transcriptional regulator, cyclic AMP receptor protein
MIFGVIFQYEQRIDLLQPMKNKRAHALRKGTEHSSTQKVEVVTADSTVDVPDSDRDLASPRSSVAKIEAAIRTHPFLEGLSPYHYRMLSDCAMEARFAAGELIFREGDPANQFYLIRTGAVALESYTRDRGAICLQTIEAGDVLGWSWMFPPYLWHFDARALEPTLVVLLEGTPLRAQCESDHDLGYKLMKRLAQVMMNRLQATRWQLLRPSEIVREKPPNKC